MKSSQQWSQSNNWVVKSDVYEVSSLLLPCYGVLLETITCYFKSLTTFRHVPSTTTTILGFYLLPIISKTSLLKRTIHPFLFLILNISSYLKRYTPDTYHRSTPFQTFSSTLFTFYFSNFIYIYQPQLVSLTRR